MNRLKELREGQKLSLASLSEALAKTKGIVLSRASLSNYERNEQHPKPEVWEKIADYFGVSVPYIMGIDSTENTNEIVITRQEHERLKEIERKYNEIKALVAD